MKLQKPKKERRIKNKQTELSPAVSLIKIPSSFVYVFILLEVEEHIIYPEHPFWFLPCLAEEVFEPHVVDHILSLMLAG